MSGKRSGHKAHASPARRPAQVIVPPATLMLQAVGLHQAGDLDGASRLYESLLADPAQRADALHYLGLVALARGDAGLARQRILAAIALLPGRPQFHCNLGNVLKRLGQRDDAALAYRNAIALDANFPEARYNLAVLCADGGDDAAAIALLREALQLRENFPPAWLALAAAFYREEHLDDAVRCYERALELRPGWPDAVLALGSLRLRQGDTRRAHAEFLALTAADPRCLEAWQGVLMTMNYLWLDPRDVLATHRRVGELLLQTAPRLAASPAITPQPGARLRVGILSPDLRRHAMRFFVRPLLDHVDHGRIELFAYYAWPTADAETESFRGRFDHWCDIGRLDDASAAQRIADDSLDVLVDLAGHSAGGRMRVLAARVAPLQVTMLGYMNTTGLATMDCRFTDAVAIPPGDEALWVEPLQRLPASQWCYAPDADTPPVNTLPLLKRGAPTLGLFHTPAKMSDEAFRCWGRLMAALPTARLLVVLWGETARLIFLERCRAVGIAAERVDCRDPLPHDRYLSLYHEVDVSLDVFPYAGGTVSCESLWMGVPFVTLATPLPQGRGGASILAAMGLAEMIAGTEDEYVERVVALVGDSEGLAGLRRELRPRMLASPLMDAGTWAGEFWSRLHDLAHRRVLPAAGK